MCKCTYIYTGRHSSRNALAPSCRRHCRRAHRSDACMSRPVDAGMKAGAGSFASPFSTRINSASSFMCRSCSKRNVPS